MPQTLFDWVNGVEVDGGHRGGLITSERDRLKQLKRENKALRRAEDSRRAFRLCGVLPLVEKLKRLIDTHMGQYGVNPICKALQIFSSCYRFQAARLGDPSLRSERAQHDETLIGHIQRVWRKLAGVWCREDLAANKSRKYCGSSVSRRAANNAITRSARKVSWQESGKNDQRWQGSLSAGWDQSGVQG